MSSHLRKLRRQLERIDARAEILRVLAVGEDGFHLIQHVDGTVEPIADEALDPRVRAVAAQVRAQPSDEMRVLELRHAALCGRARGRSCTCSPELYLDGEKVEVVVS